MTVLRTGHHVRTLLIEVGRGPSRGISPFPVPRPPLHGLSTHVAALDLAAAGFQHLDLTPRTWKERFAAPTNEFRVRPPR